MILFEDEMTVSNERLKKLKVNVHIWALQNCIDQLKAQWKPKMKTLDGIPYDEPNPIEEPCNVLYWDVSNAKWTNRDAAFKSYVFSVIKL